LRNRRLLFDANSIFTLVRELKGKAPHLLSEGLILSLAFYEVGNAIWKECHPRQRLDAREARNLLSNIFAIMRAMKLGRLDTEDGGGRALELACLLDLTYHDASYLAEARTSGSILVTDDSRLRQAAEKAELETMTTEDFKASLG